MATPTGAAYGARMTRDEAEAREAFAERYAVDREDVNREIERAVIGGDWGANGYTTMAQADEMADLLQLQPGTRLVDVGAGRGWPGLYLAASTGCSAVLADLPIEGLRAARRRAEAEALDARVSVVVASASRLPFAPESFDAAVLADVFC